MHVVSAGVHDPRRNGAKRHIGILFYRQGVDIGPQGDNIVSSPNLSHQTGAQFKGQNVDVGSTQPVANTCCSRHLL
ncbi:hypothetical protein D3C73_1460720 [compost metagenome]